MIAVDTSALIAVLKGEPEAAACQVALSSSVRSLMSAASVTEALIVAAQKGYETEMSDVLVALGIEIIDLTAARAELAAEAYRAYGRNFHRAALNFGDCFSYATAKEFGCPLLFVGNDFAQTDVRSALPPA
ncbi:type II toxin-antitoxin system VapC family toxin [Rhizobium sp. SAFR-030]|uniref:type II toxin-antitoxin system VapC family toxin n=1 Tax=Rhizobium sp. SAFR-030 TaxID=3387277 RepID=UPI003F81E196